MNCPRPCSETDVTAYSQTLSQPPIPHPPALRLVLSRCLSLPLCPLRQGNNMRNKVSLLNCFLVHSFFIFKKLVLSPSVWSSDTCFFRAKAFSNFSNVFLTHLQGPPSLLCSWTSCDFCAGFCAAGSWICCDPQKVQEGARSPKTKCQ